MTNQKFKKKLDDLLLICQKNLPKTDESLIRRAFEFGFNAHRHDIRASGEPFFDHPYEVAKIVAKEIPLDDVSVAAALMHDVAEDTEYTVNDIRAEFGDDVADIVDGATKISDIFKSHEVTQAENYRKLLLSMVDDVRVMLVKFADRLHNMRTLEYLSSEKQKRLAKETLEIYAPFAHRFGLANIKWELEDLAFKYLNREAYDAIARDLKSRRREREHYIRKFAQPIEKRLREVGYKFEISGRPKHLYSIYNKMVKRNKPLEEIYDLFAVRLILDTEDNNDCFAVYGIVADTYIPNPERFKNYISVPKKNGYQSIHTTVVGPEGRMVEVQIRTRGMHEVAERGVAAHWMYKENVAIDEELHNWVTWVREIFETAAEGQAPAQQLMESFKLNLYQDEIYLFTPKGDLKILPKGSTPVDFGYEIHSKVGDHCIAAKVNGRIVPLDTLLRSGDQVEILTSKSQTPNPDWEKFVITHKAKSHIRRWIREEQRKAADSGKEIWEKRVKKAKISINNDDLAKFLTDRKIDNTTAFFIGIKEGKIDPDEIITTIIDDQRHPHPVMPDEGRLTGLFNKFLTSARDVAGGGIVLEGHQDRYMHNYAKCCQPIPGDDVVGFVTTGEGIKIHRRSCKNIQLMMQVENNRIVDVQWPSNNGVMFVAGVRISGDDRPGMLNDITQAISSYVNTNIRSVNIDSSSGMFEGTFILNVQNTDHLNKVLERIRRIKGIKRSERFEE